MVEVAAAGAAGERGVGRAGADRKPVPLGGHFRNRGGNRRVLDVHQQVGAGIIGLRRQPRRLRSLVVIVEGIDQDGAAEHDAAEIRDRHAGRVHPAAARSRVVEVIVEVGDDGDPDRRRVCRAGNADQRRAGQQQCHQFANQCGVPQMMGDGRYAEPTTPHRFRR